MDQRGLIDLLLKDRYGSAVQGAVVKASLVRPTHEGYDFSVELASLGDGRYNTEIDLPLPGQWDLLLEVTHERGSYQLRERIFIR